MPFLVQVPSYVITEVCHDQTLLNKGSKFVKWMNWSTIPKMTWLGGFLDALTWHKSPLWRSLKTSRDKKLLRSAFLPPRSYNILWATTDPFLSILCLSPSTGNHCHSLTNPQAQALFPGLEKMYSFFMTQGRSSWKREHSKTFLPTQSRKSQFWDLYCWEINNHLTYATVLSSCESQRLKPGMIIFY